MTGCAAAYVRPYRHKLKLAPTVEVEPYLAGTLPCIMHLGTARHSSGTCRFCSGPRTLEHYFVPEQVPEHFQTVPFLEQFAHTQLHNNSLSLINTTQAGSHQQKCQASVQCLHACCDQLPIRSRSGKQELEPGAAWSLVKCNTSSAISTW